MANNKPSNREILFENLNLKGVSNPAILLIDSVSDNLVELSNVCDSCSLISEETVLPKVSQLYQSLNQLRSLTKKHKEVFEYVFVNVENKLSQYSGFYNDKFKKISKEYLF